MKDKLIFDVTDANTIADSDSVGAYLRASDGTLLTHTDVGGKKALDVRVAEGINVEVDLDAADDSVASWTHDGAGNAISSTGGALHISDAGGSLTVDATDFDIRDLSASQDNVAISDGTDTLAINADGSINITDNGGSITVDATDLDIRDLTQADEITVFQGTNPWIIGDGGGSITVDATDLDIRDLSAAQDSVQANLFDGAGTALTSTLVGADQALDVNVVNTISINDAALANTAIANAAETLDVASTAQDVVASPLANRKYLFVYNNDNRAMYIGASGVTEANGFPISPGSYMELRAGAAVDIEFVSSKLNHAIRTLELS